MITPTTCHMSRVMCHMSRVTCHMSRVTCHVSHVTIFFFKFYKMVQLISGGSIINEAYPVQFLNKLYSILEERISRRKIKEYLKTYILEKKKGMKNYFLGLACVALGHSLRLNTELAPRAQLVLGSFFVGAQIILWVVILICYAPCIKLTKNWRKNPKYFFSN